ncbi:MAG: cobalamin biosynthesis protein CobD [Firmicutes bacterium]|nr:cobalamin biosynthesis protein CobD [Bacillota bacterium]
MSFIIIAIALDIFLGDPINWPHPIIYIGNMIKRYENYIRKSNINLKFGGFLLTTLSIITVFLIVTLILKITYNINPVIEYIISIYLLYTTMATKCLSLEGKRVYNSLKDNDLEKSRKLISYLVGRDTNKLKLKEINRAIVETIAENTIDGVLAPLFYIFLGLLFNMPVEFAFVYKTVNTLDSMVGYNQEPFKDIGLISAKLDDILNYFPARIGSVLMVLSGVFFNYDIKNGFKILIRDRRNHKSPNCGYPESAVAGLLNIELGGVNTYFGKKVYKPTIGDENYLLSYENIIDSIKIMYASLFIVLTIFSIIFILV